MSSSDEEESLSIMSFSSSDEVEYPGLMSESSGYDSTDSDAFFHYTSDPNYDPDSDSEPGDDDLDQNAWSNTMCFPTCGLCRFEFVEDEEFVVCRYYPFRYKFCIYMMDEGSQLQVLPI